MNKHWHISLHILFWLFSIAAFAIVFRLSDSVDRLDFYYSALFFVSIVPGVYLNFWALGVFFQHQKYTYYLAFFMLTIALITIINFATFAYLTNWILPNYYFVNQFNLLELVIIILSFLGITTTLKLSESWFRLQQVKAKMIAIEKEHLKTELEGLKAQINPHFLFNSLNVLYSLTLKSDSATPEVILKLSDVLRYVLYDSQKDKVSLQSEVELIEKYIALQKYRIEDSSSIAFKHTIEKDTFVAPLLFLPLVENSFKHGLKGDTENTFVEFNLRVDENQIQFITRNNKKDSTDVNLEQEGGIGIKNIKKRLQLLYPNKHHFEALEMEDYFMVKLEIRHND